MALPTSVPTGTVTGRWYNRDGTDSTGTIVFQPLHDVVVPDDDDAVVVSTPITSTLSTGSISQVLPAGAYTVSVQLNGLARTRKTITVLSEQTVNLPYA